jgi:hypothetical protein
MTRVSIGLGSWMMTLPEDEGIAEKDSFLVQAFTSQAPALDESRRRRLEEFERERIRRYVFFLQQGSWVKKKMDKAKDYKDR